MTRKTFNLELFELFPAVSWILLGTTVLCFGGFVLALSAVVRARRSRQSFAVSQSSLE